MSNIQVKGINDYLLFICNDEVQEDECLDELYQLLSSPSFQKENFYVKGYFDFGSRMLSEDLFDKLLLVLKKTRNILFCGVNVVEKKQHHLAHLQGIIRNGEIKQSQEDLLFEGRINPGGHLQVQGKVFFLGCCKGLIEVTGRNACINASDLKHASIRINDKYLDDVSTDILTSFYDDGKEIKWKTEVERLWQEQL